MRLKQHLFFFSKQVTLTCRLCLKVLDRICWLQYVGFGFLNTVLIFHFLLPLKVLIVLVNYIVIYEILPLVMFT